MFGSLSNRLQGLFDRLKGRGALNEADVDAAMRDIRLALLEADVNFKVVKEFIAKVRERCVGAEVLRSVTPAQQVVKIVHDEMTALLGSTESKLLFASQPPTVVMMVGLQGSGKTTATAKLANWMRKQGHRPLMIAADIYRPAAVDQLRTLGAESGIAVFSQPTTTPVTSIVSSGLAEAARLTCDSVIIDTAGRLHIDEKMMAELQEVKKLAKPHQVLLVVDSMTGQDAVNIAGSFQEQLDFDGIILTKLDGDARGGAALSMRSVTGKPIKFASLGEKIDSLEVFHPDRLASRILGMGDILSLVEKAQEVADVDKAREMEAKLRKAEFTFDDFLDQMKQLRQMGPIGQILKMIPGVSGAAAKNLKVSDSDLTRLQAMIESMTAKERNDPSIIAGSRRKRIAAGSGTTVYEVNQLLKQFAQTKKMLKSMMGGKGGRKGLPFPR